MFVAEELPKFAVKTLKHLIWKPTQFQECQAVAP